MAHMYPPTLSNDHASHAERLMFSLLAHQLGEDFFCYHSLPSLTRGRWGAREGEIDFVVLHRELGLLALEVKGGGLFRDGQGRWYRNDAVGRRSKLERDPFAQARDNMHALVDLLQHRLGAVLPEWGGKLALPYGHAVVLPEATLPAGGPLPEGMAAELLLDAGSLDALEQHVLAAMRYWAGESKAPTPRELKRFRSGVLHPALSLAPSLASYMRSEHAQLCLLTDDQVRVLKMASELPRVVVKGAAGTGKTVLAVEKARRLAQEGRRTCLLCFNRPLSELIRAQLEDAGEGWPLQVCTFHALCRQAAVLLERSFEVPAAQGAADFWRSTAPEFLLDAVSEGKLGFDALVVDEGQDLESEWWVTLEALIPADGPLWVFSDPQQDIYQRAPLMPQGLAPLVLFTNCRATRKLRELCDRLSGVTTDSPPLAPEGEPHEELIYSSPSDLRAKLEARVGALLGQGLDPAQLVILAPHRPENTSLAGLASIAGVPLVGDRGQRGLLISTARRFKGLEADVVLLIDQDPTDPACSGVHRYVAASRARHRLIVFTKGAWA